MDLGKVNPREVALYGAVLELLLGQKGYKAAQGVLLHWKWLSDASTVAESQESALG